MKWFVGVFLVLIILSAVVIFRTSCQQVTATQAVAMVREMPEARGYTVAPHPLDNAQRVKENGFWRIELSSGTKVTKTYTVDFCTGKVK